MSDVNVVVISGGLTRDPELRALPSGTEVLNFSVGFSSPARGADGAYSERSNYADCAVFGPRARALGQILRKGMRVTVQGRLRFESWERDGERRSKLCVVADEVSLPPRPKDAPQDAPEQPAAPCPEPAPGSLPYGDWEPQAELDLGDYQGGYAGVYGRQADARPAIPSPYGY